MAEEKLELAQQEQAQVEEEQDIEFEESFKEFSKKRSQGVFAGESEEQEQREEQEAAGTGKVEGEEEERGESGSKETGEQILDDIKDIDIDAILAENQQLKHKARSAEGRVSAYQKKINEQAEKIAQIRLPEQDDQDDEEWQDIKDTFPEIAEAFEKKLSRMRVQIEKNVAAEVSKTVAPILSEAEQRRVEEQTSRETRELEALEKVYPDWRKDVSSDAFEEWFLDQSAGVRRLFESDDSRDAVALLGLYHGQSQPTKKAGKEEVAAVIEKRNKQLKQGRTLETKAHGQRIDTNDGDFETEFKAFSKQRDKRKAERGGYNYF